MKFFRSIQFSLLVVLVVVALSPVLVITLFNLNSSTRLFQEEIEARQTEVMTIIASEVSGFIQDIEQHLTEIGEAVTIMDFNRKQIDRYLLLETEDGLFSSLWVIDAEGKEIGGVVDGVLLGQYNMDDRHEEEIFFRPQRGEVYYSNIRLIGESPRIHMAVPIYEGRTFKGVVAAVINLSQPWDVIREIQLGENGYAMLIDQRGNLIVHRDSNLLSRALNFANTPGVAAVMRGDTPAVYYYTSPISGDVMGNATRIDGPEWVLVLERPQHEAFATINQANQNMLVALVVSVALAALLSLLMSRQIVRPIIKLRDVVRKVQAGDLSLRAKIERDDELGQFATAFNTMTERLQEMVGTLEARVAARTRDLEVASDVTREVSTVLDINTLMKEVTRLVAMRFDIDAAVILLYDENDQSLNAKAAANHGGENYDDIGFPEITLETRPSLIALAARSRKTALIADVSTSDQYLPVSRYADTRSELAVPIIYAEQLLGVFDLQSSKVNGFGANDIKVMTALAGQIAVALRNAQLFTEMKQAQESAERANSVKSQFLAAVSHELRTPLNAIINFTRFVVDGVMGPVTDEQVNLLNEVVKAGKHLLSLINDILDISKIEAGALKLNVTQAIDLKEELQMVVTAVEPMLHGKPVRMLVEIPDNLPPIPGDSRRIRQIVMNLMSNACKFTEEGSVKLSLAVQGDEILISVADTGEGIDESERELVFGTFQQTRSGMNSGGGTGLGLPISRRLVEAHGGRLWFDSVVGKGSTFYVTLPVELRVMPEMMQLED